MFIEITERIKENVIQILTIITIITSETIERKKIEITTKKKSKKVIIIIIENIHFQIIAKMTILPKINHTTNNTTPLTIKIKQVKKALR